MYSTIKSKHYRMRENDFPRVLNYVIQKELIKDKSDLNSIVGIGQTLKGLIKKVDQHYIEAKYQLNPNKICTRYVSKEEFENTPIYKIFLAANLHKSIESLRKLNEKEKVVCALLAIDEKEKSIVEKFVLNQEEK